MELHTSIASTIANCERLEQNVVIVTIVLLSESFCLKVLFAKNESSSYKQYDIHRIYRHILLQVISQMPTLYVMIEDPICQPLIATFDANGR